MQLEDEGEWLVLDRVQATVDMDYLAVDALHLQSFKPLIIRRPRGRQL